MKAYNYSIVFQTEEKFVIPFTNFKIKNKFYLVISVTVSLLIVTLFLLIFKRVFYGRILLFLSIAIFMMINASFVFIITSVNSETQNLKIQEFYYQNIRKYKNVVDRRGQQHFLIVRKYQRNLVYLGGEYYKLFGIKREDD